MPLPGIPSCGCTGRTCRSPGAISAAMWCRACPWGCNSRCWPLASSSCRAWWCSSTCWTASCVLPAQMGFGAANKLFNLTATPMNALGTAMTSFTAQNLGAGNHDRIRKGALQSLVMVSLLAAMAVGIGLLLTLGNAYLRIFLSADKITMDTVRYGNTFLVCGLRHVPVPRASFSWCATASRASAGPGSCWGRCGGAGGPDRRVPDPSRRRGRRRRQRPGKSSGVLRLCARRTPWPGSPPTSFWPSPSSGTSCGGITGI
ncbi:MAG: MATE family efflux transporter [Oscillospiraceae bacterium]